MWGGGVSSPPRRASLGEAINAQRPLTSQGSNPSGLEGKFLRPRSLGKAGKPLWSPRVCVLGLPGVTAPCCPLSETRALKVTVIVGGGTRSHLLILARNSKVRSEKEETG